MGRERGLEAHSMRSAFPTWTPMVRRLILIQATLFIVCFALYLASEASWISILENLGLDSERFRGAGIPPLYQLFTYGFLHSVTNITHVLYNMLTLYFFGGMLEERFGGRALLCLYLCAQIAGAALFLVASWLFGSQPVLIGASGACYGVMFAVATLMPQRQVIFLIFPLTLRSLAWILFGMTVFMGLLDLKHGVEGGVSHATHLGGLVWGVLAAKLGFAGYDPAEAWRRSRVAADAQRAINQAQRSEADAARMDQLLEKIHREGMAALSADEKDFLRRASQRKS